MVKFGKSFNCFEILQIIRDIETSQIFCSNAKCYHGNNFAKQLPGRQAGTRLFKVCLVTFGNLIHQGNI